MLHHSSLDPVQPAAKDPAAKKPYHTPQLQEYGLVNDLTRSGGSIVTDGASIYTDSNNG